MLTLGCVVHTMLCQCLWNPCRRCMFTTTDTHAHMHPGPRTHIHADIQTYADRQVPTEFTHRAFGTVSRLFVESDAHIHTSYTPTHTGRFTRSSHFVRFARFQDLLLNYMSRTRFADFRLRREHNDIANVCRILEFYMHFYHCWQTRTHAPRPAHTHT